MVGRVRLFTFRNVNKCLNCICTMQMVPTWPRWFLPIVLQLRANEGTHRKRSKIRIFVKHRQSGSNCWSVDPRLLHPDPGWVHHGGYWQDQSWRQGRNAHSIPGTDNIFLHELVLKVNMVYKILQNNWELFFRIICDSWKLPKYRRTISRTSSPWRSLTSSTPITCGSVFPLFKGSSRKAPWIWKLSSIQRSWRAASMSSSLR